VKLNASGEEEVAQKPKVGIKFGLSDSEKPKINLKLGSTDSEKPKANIKLGSTDSETEKSSGLVKRKPLDMLKTKSKIKLK